MKVALVHYWFYGMRGGEKVVAEILRQFPEADLFTHLYLPDNLDPLITNRPVRTTFVNNLPFAGKLYQAYLPLMPAALKKLDLSQYDLIISSESGPAKGIIKRPDAVHVCYCHSPMRYIWDQQPVYLKQANIFQRLFLKSFTPYLRRWDVDSAQSVDHFIANSKNVQERISRIYNRESKIIFPPVDLEQFQLLKEKKDFFLLAGQLVPYKQPDLAVAAFNQLGYNLKVVGAGSMLSKLRSAAGSNIEFLGQVSDLELSRMMGEARALIFPGEEDFGIIPVEAQAAGTPVIALGKGGVLETVNGLDLRQAADPEENYTGIFYSDPVADDLVLALKKFIEVEKIFHPHQCRENAEQFSTHRFRREFKLFVEQMPVNALPGSE